MPRIAKKVSEQISEGIKTYQPILKKAFNKDINKSDTLVIVIDILNDVLGFDKYEEVTNEFFIGNTFCDLAVKVEETLSLLVEIKAIGFPLKNEHICKVRSFAKKRGIRFVLLTNGIEWQLFETDPNSKRQNGATLNINFLELQHENKPDIEELYTISKDGIIKSFLRDYKEKESTLNRYVISAVMLSDNFSNLLKKELKKLNSYHDFDDKEIKDILQHDVIKREITDNIEVKRTIKRIKNLKDRDQKDGKIKEPIDIQAKVS